MKFGTVIGLVVGALAMLAAGAAAMYVFLNGFPCCHCKDEEDEDDLYDEFPEEEIITDAEEAAEEIAEDVEDAVEDFVDDVKEIAE